MSAMLRFGPVQEDEIGRAFEIEAASYPADEAATHDGLCMRQRVAGQYFLGCYAAAVDGSAEELIGFVCGTCCAGTELTDETMSTHSDAPDATTLCVHSVVVDAAHRRRGVASATLREYLRRLVGGDPATAKVREVFLIAKANLLGFYTGCGFVTQRLSPVVHGADPWFEMRLRPHCAERRQLAVTQVDAFVLSSAAAPEQPEHFTGNPAAVVVLPPSAVDAAQAATGRLAPAAGTLGAWMQSVAVEMALSETSYLRPLDGGGGEGEGEGEGDKQQHRFSLRWFTPGCEVDLCGHATMASAHAVWERGLAPRSAALTFISRSGELRARLGPPDAAAGSPERVLLDFPAEPPTATPAPGDGGATAEDGELRPLLRAAFGLAEAQLLWVGRSRVDVLCVVEPVAFAALLGKAPDFSYLNQVRTRGVILSCRGYPGEGAANAPDFSSRWFGHPDTGVVEDPVTGSAHCCLAPYWAEQLGLQRPLLGRQCSSRGGDVVVRLTDGGARVELAGRAITSMTGRLLTPPPPQQQ